MSWNYRIFRKTYTRPGGRKEHAYCIGEAYYRSGNKVRCWSVDSIPASGETVGELTSDLKMMLEGANRYKNRVLDHKTGKLVRK